MAAIIVNKIFCVALPRQIFKKGLISLLLTGWLSGCTLDAESPRGFSLPKGSAEAGQQAFVDMECTACHTVAGVDLPAAEEMLDVAVRLGGKTTRVKTYADLVTSVINPSHKLVKGLPKESIQMEGVSRMPVYNDIMTVTQLIDIVTFLEEHYEVISYNPTIYSHF